MAMKKTQQTNEAKKAAVPCIKLPFAGYSQNKVKPATNFSTALLIEMINVGVIGGDLGRDCLKRDFIPDPDNVRNRLLVFLPILSNYYFFNDWTKSPLFKPWKHAIAYFQNFIKDHSIQSWNSHFSQASNVFFNEVPDIDGHNKTDVFQVFFSLLFLLYLHKWEDSEVLNDFKMLHRLLYHLSANCLFIPSIEQAKEIEEKSAVTDLTKLINDEKGTGSLLKGHIFFDDEFLLFKDRFENDAEELEAWVNKKMLEDKSQHKALLLWGNLDIVPKIAAIYLEGFVNDIIISLLNVILDSYRHETAYLSLGQLNIGICNYCGKLIVRSILKQRFCADNSNKCQKSYRQKTPDPSIELEIKSFNP